MQIDASGCSPTVFDQTAADFTAKIDRLIDAGRYNRGRLFLNAAVSNVPRQGRILDYGCGPGRITALLARQGFNVLGLDPSPAMISVARQQNLSTFQAEFDLCGSRPFGAQTEEFDAIVCSSVIEYESQPVQLLRRFSSALRSSGVLIISFANSSSVSRALFQRRNLHLGAQVHTWTGGQFAELLTQSGFHPISPTVYFESVLDRITPLGFLSAFPRVGALGLVVAGKRSG